MTIEIDEIAAGVHRLSTYVPEIAPPAGFTFNQFLVDADEPLLYHTGPRLLFAEVAQAVGRVLGSVDRLRRVSFAHLGSDESGSTNHRLEAVPHAEIVSNETGCLVSVDDLAVRPPHVLADGEVLADDDDRRALAVLERGWQGVAGKGCPDLSDRTSDNER